MKKSKKMLIILIKINKANKKWFGAKSSQGNIFSNHI